MCADLLEAGDGVHEFDVQLGVVLSQGLVPVVADELHHRAERQGVGEAVLPVPMVDLYQLVVSPLPEKIQVKKKMSIYIFKVEIQSRQTLLDIHSLTASRSGLGSPSSASLPGQRALHCLDATQAKCFSTHDFPQSVVN